MGGVGGCSLGFKAALLGAFLRAAGAGGGGGGGRGGRAGGGGGGGAVHQAIDLFLEMHSVVGQLGVIAFGSCPPKQDILCGNRDYAVFVCWRSKAMGAGVRACVHVCEEKGHDLPN